MSYIFSKILEKFGISGILLGIISIITVILSGLVVYDTNVIHALRADIVNKQAEILAYKTVNATDAKAVAAAKTECLDLVSEKVNNIANAEVVNNIGNEVLYKVPPRVKK